MTSSFLENVKKYLFSKDVARYCMIYSGNSPKRDFDFKSKFYIQTSDIENLNFLSLFHGLLFYLLEKGKKIRGHRTNYLSRGPNIAPPPHMSRII